jgi:hypothetical protein
MNRAFISLYLILVLAIVLLGVVLNKFWEEFNPAADVDPAIADLIALVETQINRVQTPQAADQALRHYQQRCRRHQVG